MSVEREITADPFASPKELVFDQGGASPAGLRISIADMLFCTFAVSVSLACLFQQWGEYEEVRPIYAASSLLVAFSASVFFTANRIRISQGRPFSSMAPGHLVALLGAGYLGTYLFQFFVSFLDSRIVGDPIHILSTVSPYLFCIAIGVIVLWRTKWTPRWQAYFGAIVAYGVLGVASSAASLLGSHTDYSDPMNVTAMYLSRIGFGVWSLTALFLAIAYFLELFMSEARDWLHHAGVALGLFGVAAQVVEDRQSMLTLQMLFYRVFSL